MESEINKQIKAERRLLTVQTHGVVLLGLQRLSVNDGIGTGKVGNSSSIQFIVCKSRTIVENVMKIKSRTRDERVKEGEREGWLLICGNALRNGTYPRKYTCYCVSDRTDK